MPGFFIGELTEGPGIHRICYSVCEGIEHEYGVNLSNVLCANSLASIYQRSGFRKEFFGCSKYFTCNGIVNDE